MSDEADILWGMYKEHTTQGRHHEIQRAAMTNLIMAICAGVLGLFALDKSPTTIHLVLAIFLVVLGLFGAVFSAKHYERFSMHMERARGYRDALEQALPSTNIKEIKDAADFKAKKKYPKLFDLRLFWFWMALHVVVAAVGLILSIWVVSNYQSVA